LAEVINDDCILLSADKTNFSKTQKCDAMKRSGDISRIYWQLLLDGQRLHMTFYGDHVELAYPRLITTC